MKTKQLLRRAYSWTLLLASAWLLTNAQAAEHGTNVAGATPPPQTLKVREPAVAGLFYPADREALSQIVDRLLASAAGPMVDNVKALVCPHAGYPYSGPTAAQAYRTVKGKNYRTVIIMAPSHYAAFDGIAVTASDAYRSPLGLVKISDQARKLASLKPFLPEPRCLVQRPSWFTQSSRTPPPTGEDTPETWEHSIEVQLPFLQKSLKDFQLVPLIFGEVDPAKAARVLAEQLDDSTLLIASSDLSHYHPYDEAKTLDERCVKDICNLNLEAVKDREACGKSPILTVMHVARQKGWKTRLLDYRNSGDTSGNKQGVVGYAAIAFYAPAVETVKAAEKKQLLALARQTLKECVAGGKAAAVDVSRWPADLQEPKGCFVTLTKQGRLRGCIGHIFPKEPLVQAIVDNARSAALQDPRFPPVTADELGQIEIEISLLTVPQPLAFASPEDLLMKLRPRVDGVVLKIGTRGATYLPQVWEQLPDKVLFLNQLAEKAGCDPSDWRKPGTEILVYQAEAFRESEP
jgi:AmmeMemoRadiSam system protein A